MSTITLHDSGKTPQRSELGGSGGFAHVTGVPGGNLVIAEIDALTSTAETFDFSATPIKALVDVILVPEAAMTIDPHTAVICIDPPNAAVRDIWLTAGDYLTGLSQRIPVVVGRPFEPLIFLDSTGRSTSIDYVGIKLDLGASNCRAFAIGVEA